ncbi:RNase adapter RapZ [Streptomyces sp. NPDC029006]|uniref:RapZ C-terminal domain-containing protein n=1 Tax=Streptomyces sp. NPDC029006 TaxID=3155467 RepID=UPI0033E6D9A9
MATIQIISFGYLHAPAPEADVVLDLRRAFRDPHVDPRLRQMTGRDRPVQQAVLATAGIRRTLRATVRQVQAYAAGPSADRIVIAPGCAGGRHRSVVVTDQLARRLRRRGHTVTVHHRDIQQPVIHR